MALRMPARALTGAFALGGLGQKPMDAELPLAAGTGSARAIALPALTGAPPSVIRSKACTVLVSSVVDHSGSMYGAWGDPNDVTGAAAESLMLLQRKSGGGRAVIVPWGSSAPRNMVVGPLDVNKGHAALSHGLRVHGSMGGNDLPAALRRLKEVVPTPKAGETHVHFVFTDGGEDVTQELFDALNSLPPASVHMVLIDRMNTCTAEMEAEWNTAPFGSVTRVVQLDVASIAVHIAGIYATALGLPSTAVRVPAIKKSALKKAGRSTTSKNTNTKATKWSKK